MATAARSARRPGAPAWARSLAERAQVRQLAGHPRLAPLRRWLAPVTSLGWTVAALATGAWAVGAWSNWEELLVLAGACIVALAISLALTVGRLALDVDVEVAPRRIQVGQEAIGSVEVANRRARPSLGARVEVPVGDGVVELDIGTLAPGARRSEPFVVPGRRRSVIPIGPARSVKGDPVGIARREVAAGQQVLLYVHPTTIVLPSLAAGWIRDLEGQTTNDLSTSDVAFHTLREYVPGDDRRHIHWRTTARLGTMMVRQFVDTRRSHLGLVLATDPAAWEGEDEIELGVSVVGSLGRTALLDGQEVTALAGGEVLATTTPDLLLDGLAGVEVSEHADDLPDLVRRSLPRIRSASVVAVVVGSAVTPSDLLAACARFRRDQAILAVRCRPGLPASRRRSANVSVIEVGRLDDLARVLAVVGAW